MKTLFIITAMLGLLACGRRTTEPANTAGTVGDDSVAATYSLDDDIGEMLLVGFRGTSIDSSNHIWRDIKEYRVGSVILFDYDVPTGTRGRNIKAADQVSILCHELRQLSPTLLIGIDQEGGNVSRLSSRYGFPSIMSAQKSAAKGLDTVRHYARLTAAILNSCGINLNFAPVADVNVNPQCPVIGGIGRSFSDDPDMVTECCKIWIDEQRSEGVVSCLKHFPGHGSAKGDTHKGLVDVTTTWQRSELTPYRDLGNPYLMVMTAHVINRQLDPSGLPASLSPKITSLLRDSLGFQGVIVTDDLAMGAISSHYSLQQTIALALEAGADLLCLSNNGSHYDEQLVAKTVKIIKQLVADGRVDANRLRASADRVRALKAYANGGK